MNSSSQNIILRLLSSNWYIELEYKNTTQHEDLFPIFQYLEKKNMNAISKNIRHLRQQRSWTQGHLAKKLGITTPALSKIEAGDTDLNFSRLNQIAGVFNVEPAELVTTPEEKNKHYLNIAQLKNILAKKDSAVIKLQYEIIRIYEGGK
ncbi:helix-turn-helix domain-containing protein [Pedobacter nyackensis]|uniref:Helix-turn-helix domain-containing protein n=1 Tax=Pedobacter nyackensis TaxID=475255 RepID=A0A1W2BZW0_9SPHI|nr:helix-turn-helix transcriptional regulator [Pedobacter nyackensis]SMC78430.1 Helix-turn-helix domain-containing protein [Pedobacter nyackensis]